jgi:hypothetical protein
MHFPRLLAFILAICASSCDRVRCSFPFERDAEPLLGVHTGPALLPDFRFLWVEGEVHTGPEISYTQPGGNTYCASIHPEDIQALTESLESEEVRESLRRIADQRWGEKGGSVAMITIDYGGESVVMPFDAVPPEIQTVLALVDDIWRARFGWYYEKPISPLIE